MIVCAPDQCDPKSISLGLGLGLNRLNLGKSGDYGDTRWVLYRKGMGRREIL